MSYQGARARPLASEAGRSFEVSRVRIGPDGHVSEVLWGGVHPGTDGTRGADVRAPVSEVVDALHDGARVSAVFPAARSAGAATGHGHGRPAERDFVVVEHADGRECITFEPGAHGPWPGRELADMARLTD